MIISKPGECCAETYIVLGAFDTEQEVCNYKSYILTKIVRFLILQTVVSQDVVQDRFCFVPDFNDYTQSFSDEKLIRKWNISDIEWNYIQSRVLN